MCQDLLDGRKIVIIVIGIGDFSVSSIRGEMAAETRSSQAPTADRSPLLFGETCRASWLYIRHIPPFTNVANALPGAARR
jgi:hypothetical protein